MKENLKQHEQVLKDLNELIEKFKDQCLEDETNIDLSPYNLDIQLTVKKKNDKLYVSEKAYDELLTVFLSSINITLNIEELRQQKVPIDGKNHICLNDIKICSIPYFNALNKSNITNESSYLNKKPFFSRIEEQEEWNVKMIDSIINNIVTKENNNNIKNTIIEQPRQKKRKINKLNEQLSSRPFVCQFKDCNSAFKRFEHLKRHNRIHTGERPFKCTFPGCYKKFARSDNLSQHLKIHNTKHANFSNDSLSFYRNKF